MGYRLADNTGDTLAVPQLVLTHLCQTDGDTIRAALYILQTRDTDPRTMARALALPSTGVTLLTYAVHDHVDWSMGIPLALGGLLSISWGVKLAHALPERVLRGLFCGFLVLCALLLALE